MIKPYKELSWEEFLALDLHNRDYVEYDLGMELRGPIRRVKSNDEEITLTLGWLAQRTFGAGAWEKIEEFVRIKIGKSSTRALEESGNILLEAKQRVVAGMSRVITRTGDNLKRPELPGSSSL